MHGQGMIAITYPEPANERASNDVYIPKPFAKGYEKDCQDIPQISDLSG